ARPPAVPLSPGGSPAPWRRRWISGNPEGALRDRPQLPVAGAAQERAAGREGRVLDEGPVAKPLPKLPPNPLDQVREQGIHTVGGLPIRRPRSRELQDNPVDRHSREWDVGLRPAFHRHSLAPGFPAGRPGPGPADPDLALTRDD